ncbi:hypothetical protein TREVI0001_2037 [Treponema vincentii ATCC 35580]|uniref:Uncharacterized protein n=1 Tax=Treponema vincentii ATCC 35580 TaxID=596324 RepID=C8PQD4_9SPIR|nr:hypothetical protein TREVI0001_2037 [Treponema vincentii ATCC 35580]
MVLKTGHWCPECCSVPPWNFGELAKPSRFMRNYGMTIIRLMKRKCVPLRMGAIYSHTKKEAKAVVQN